MFEAEFFGLKAIADAGCIRTPVPLCFGQTGDHSYLVIEYIELGRPDDHSQVLAGQQLAALHRQTSSRFGWDRSNTIGSTHQPNHRDDDWSRFWQHQRLGFQLQLAEKNGYGGSLQRLGKQLIEKVPLLMDHDPQPALLHGDLWGGNMSFDQQGQPVIYDPATYYGDREADLAMTELFGGFSGDFYAAYNEAWPLDPGYKTRKTLYNLYHIINHLNLFGRGYLGQAQGMMERLLAVV